jgi:hypothetical protein
MTGRFIIAAFLIILLSSCEKNDERNDTVLKLYGDALEDIGYSIAKTETGYFIGGQITEVSRDGNLVLPETSVRKLAVIKTDINGNVLWKKTFGRITSCGSKVIALSDGSAVCTGYILDTITKLKDIFVVKISSDGKTSVEKTFNSKGLSSNGDPSDGNQYGIDIVQSGDGFMLLGSTDIGRLQTSTGNTAGKTELFLLKLAADLTLSGVPESIGFPGNDEGVAIKPAISGGFIIAGTTDRSEPGQALNNILIIRTNSNGSETGYRIIGTESDEYASDLEVLKDGYFIAGTVGSSSVDQSVYVSKLPEDINGPQEFQSAYVLNSPDITATSFAIKAISPYKTSSFVFAGQAGTGSSAKMLVFIADLTGQYVDGKEIISSATGTQVAYDVLTDDRGDIITVGKNSFENDSMISFYKFRF